MAHSTHDTRQAILDFLERAGEAPLQDIAAMLGPEWREPAKNVLLRQLLRRMARTHLRNDGHGIYALSANYRLRALDRFDSRRKAIKKFLVERCGDAGTDEIHKAVGWRNLADGARDYEHQLTHRVLREAPEFCSLGDGRWSLVPEELERLPLLGERAGGEIQVKWYETGGWGDFATWKDAQAGFFDKVGNAFMEARGGLTLRDVVLAPDVGEALRVMVDRVPSIQHEAINALDKALGPEALRLSRDDEQARIAEHIYDAFEFGDVRLHLVAPPALYQGCGRLFGVCPARLSRGVVVPVADPDRGEPRGETQGNARAVSIAENK